MGQACLLSPESKLSIERQYSVKKRKLEVCFNSLKTFLFFFYFLKLNLGQSICIFCCTVTFILGFISFILLNLSFNFFFFVQRNFMTFCILYVCVHCTDHQIFFLSVSLSLLYFCFYSNTYRKCNNMRHLYTVNKRKKCIKQTSKKS